jgi:oligopeptide transport system substrate-binding protein
VKLKRITFIPISTGSTAVNLYKAGASDAMDGGRLPQEIFPLLGKKKDFHYTSAFFTLYPVMNTTRAPFDNPLVRYAFNMATDKEEIANFFGAGRAPALNFIPPFPGYRGPEKIEVQVRDKNVDVLSYDPRAARELIALAGYRKGHRLSIEYLFPTLPHSRPIAEILQQQWRRNLGVDVRLVLQEFRVWMQSGMELNYSGIAEWGFWPSYIDPYPFLELFGQSSAQNCTGWTSSEFDSALVRANATPDHGERMQLLADCEQRLLRAMPIIPLFFYSWVYLQKPFVRGLSANAIDVHPFKYVWIDTNWRPS